jgi:hypothetical protein
MPLHEQLPHVAVPLFRYGAEFALFTGRGFARDEAQVRFDVVSSFEAARFVDDSDERSSDDEADARSRGEPAHGLVALRFALNGGELRGNGNGPSCSLKK